jgi:hypothetical protein
VDTAAERRDVLWAAERSERYHARRQAFFDRWRRVTLGANVLFGSAAAVDLLKDGGPEVGHSIAIVAAFAVAFLSAVDMVISTAEMARLHNELRKKFVTLQAKIRRSSEAPTEAEIHAFQDERLAIEVDEPPIYVVIDLLCVNEIERANGRPPRVKIKTWQAITGHWWHWPDIDAEI